MIFLVETRILFRFRAWQLSAVCVVILRIPSLISRFLRLASASCPESTFLS